MYKPSTKYRHLFFDLDHTLWDFDSNAKETLIEIYSLFKLAEKEIHPFEDFYSFYLKHNSILWDRYHNGFITSEELKWKRMWRTLLDFKIGDELLAKQMSAEFLNILPTKKKLFEFKGDSIQFILNIRNTPRTIYSPSVPGKKDTANV